MWLVLAVHANHKLSKPQMPQRVLEPFRLWPYLTRMDELDKRLLLGWVPSQLKPKGKGKSSFPNGSSSISALSFVGSK